MPKKILIVDDHADLRKLIRLTLLGPDYQLPITSFRRP